MTSFLFYFTAGDASCVNCQEKIEKLKNSTFIKPKKSLTSDPNLGKFKFLNIDVYHEMFYENNARINSPYEIFMFYV